MDNIVTYEQLLIIDKTILENSNQYFNVLLDEEIYRQYNLVDIKKKLKVLFSQFKSARYLYDFPISQNIKITSNLELRENSFVANNKSKIEQVTEKYIDKQLYTTDVYNSIIKASYNLTNDEVVYLINTFLTHKSEDDIAEIIGISKTYLQKIKKSCIVKLWIALKKYCNEDD